MNAWRLWPWKVVTAAAMASVGVYLAYRGTVPRAPLKPVGKAVVANVNRRALLVGCGDYMNPDIRPLEGPANDVQLLKQVLTERCGFSPEAITTLAGDATSSQAPTRANIEREFRRLQTVAQKDDQIVVLLAGHGSQQPNQADDIDDVEPDGLDEIFLPIDTQHWSGATSDAGSVVNAIIDDEIHRWTTAIAEKGATVWVIFDCCCAGTLIRGGYDEVPRFVLASEKLKVPKQTLPKQDRRQFTSGLGGGEATWDASASDRIVAFYACQADESELELNLPPASSAANTERSRHGLFTYALCSSLSQPIGESLTYRELLRDVWLRYRAWGRAVPTPFVDGAIDRQVLGDRQRSRRFRVGRRSGRDGIIDGGALEGLTPGSIVALYTSPIGETGTDEHPNGYARVTSVQTATARIVPCPYGEIKKTAAIEVGTWCELAYADFGDMRLKVAVDRESQQSAAGGTVALAELADQLQSLSSAPTSAFKVVDDLATADWVVQARGSAVELLEKSAAEIAVGEPLPLGAPHFVLGEAGAADTVERLLERVFRARNLIKLASGFQVDSATGRDPVKIKVELLTQSGDPLPDQTVLRPGDKVQWKITNNGRSAVDLTLLFVDSELAIAAAYPQADDLEGNRLEPGETVCRIGTVYGNTVGTEHLVAIAARARGPQRNFCCLAEPSLAAAQSAAPQVRGGQEDVLQSPLGQLMRYALYNDPSLVGATRGLTSVDADDCHLTLRAWVVKPN